MLALGAPSGSIVLVGCDSGADGPPPLPDGITREGPRLLVDLARFPALTADRGALWIANQDVLVIRVGAAYRAFRSVCPHEGEDVTVYEPAGAADYQLRCPAHDWTFALDGAPTGRSPSGLQPYATTLDGDTLTITLSA